ncbi:MAG: PilZ domain-containing protein [Acidobacteria bacterium]|nr:PilZ domain-containing protein [Acidobacteriota bacterium]
MDDSNETGTARRRSTRILLRVPLFINALRQSDEPTWERVETVTVSKHGGMVRAREPYNVGDTLEIHIREKGRSARARVVWTSSRVTAQGIELGFELLDDEAFWEITFPPDRWTGREQTTQQEP